MASSGIKEVVSVLCELLEGAGFTPVEPEVLRKAKFNDSSVVCRLY